MATTIGLERDWLAFTFPGCRVLPGSSFLANAEPWWASQARRLSEALMGQADLTALLEELVQQLFSSGLRANQGALESYLEIEPLAELWRMLAGVCQLRHPERTALEAAEANTSSRLYCYLAAHYAHDAGRAEDSYRWVTQALAVNSSCIASQRLLVKLVNTYPQLDDHYNLRGVEEYLAGRTCFSPWVILSTGFAGQSFLCQCPAWLPYESGNVMEAESPEAVWQSEAASELRASIRDGSFRYCNRIHCQAISARSLPSKELEMTVVPESPWATGFHHDNSCNLSCPSCRTKPFMAEKKDHHRHELSAEKVLLPLIRSSRATQISNGGEPFSSRVYLRLLKSINRRDFPHLTVNMLSNAQLIDAKLWAQFPDLPGVLGRLAVSVDAATKETYEILRRPGKWERLCEAMEFLGEARRRGDMESLGINFVVQARNFREIPDFLNLGKKWGVDNFWFQRVVNYGTYTDEEFRKLDVAEPTHPDHQEFLAILREGGLADPSVNAYCFQYLVPEIRLFADNKSAKSFREWSLRARSSISPTLVALYPEQHLTAVREHYQQHLDNYKLSYGEVLQAARPKDLGVLLDHQFHRLELQPGMRLLDAGCGFAGVSRWFARRLPLDIAALTLDSSTAAQARAGVAADGLETQIQVVEGDFHDLTSHFAADSFDRVFFIESIGHAHSLKLVLEGAQVVLKPGGMLYIKDWFLTEFEVGSQEAAYSQATHTAIYAEYSWLGHSRQGMLKALTDAGFEIRLEEALPFSVDGSARRHLDELAGFRWSESAPPFYYAYPIELMACKL